MSGVTWLGCVHGDCSCWARVRCYGQHAPRILKLSRGLKERKEKIIIKGSLPDFHIDIILELSAERIIL